MGEIETIYEGVGTMTYIGFNHHKKWTQAAAMDDQDKIIREMRVLNDSSSMKGFLKGLAKPLKGW